MRFGQAKWHLLAFILVTGGVVPADEQLHRSGVPGWVEESGVDLEQGAVGGQGAVQYLLFDYQANIEEAAKYQNVVVALHSEEGVKDFAQLDFDFQPDYQEVILHHIRIHRDGETQERLETAEFEVIQREEGMHNELYDGEKTAYTILEDVRPGDVLSYAYTIRGRNPIFGGREHGRIRMAYSVPVGLLKRRILWDPEKRNLEWQILGEDVKAPDESELDHLRVVDWTIPDSPAREIETNTPPRFFDYSWLEWSDYGTWGGFGDWALPIYSDNGPLPGDLKAICEQIRSENPSPEEEITGVLRWVQRNVRYLGSFLNEHTHAPHELDDIFRRRFGDCKDKGVLTIAMLRHLGHDAAPALVNTSRHEAVDQFLPGHAAFNHLIVHLDHGGEDYFLDPTHTHQRGNLGELSLPAYGSAFIIRPDQHSLHPAPLSGREVDTFQIEEVFVIESLSGAATLKVVSVAMGGEANSLRRTLADDSLEEVQKNYKDFYDGFFPGIEVTDQLEIEDDEQANRIELRESYRIPLFWTEPKGDDDRWRATVGAEYLRSILDSPERQERRHPYQISFPSKITQTSEVTFPEGWPTDPSNKSISHPSFRYTKEVVPRWNGFRATYEFEALQPEVAAEDFTSYRDRIDELVDNLYMYLSHDGVESPSGEAVVEDNTYGDFPILMLGVSACAGVLTGVLLAVGMFFYDPTARPSLESDPKGLGGWMILPVIGTVMSPFTLLAAAISWAANLDEMGVILDEESGFGVWRGYYAAGMFLNTLSLAPSIMLVMLLFWRRTSFPVAYPLCLLLEVLTLGILYALELRIENIDPPANPNEMLRAFVGLLIWGLYMMTSKRVMATFVVRRKPGSPPLLPQSAAPNDSVPDS